MRCCPAPQSRCYPAPQSRWRLPPAALPELPSVPVPCGWELPCCRCLPCFAGQVTSLNIDARQLPETLFAAVLPSLAALRSLRLGTASIPPAAVCAAAALPALTRLELEASFLPLPPLEPLAALPRLAWLRLVDDGTRDAPLALPPASAFRGGRGLASLTVYMQSLCQVPAGAVG